MSNVYYKVSPLKSHLDPAGITRYIARPDHRQKIGIEEICKIISHRTSANESSVMQFLYELCDVVPELLMSNYTVHLDPFGSYSLSFKCKPVDSPELVSYRNISGVRVQFRAGKRIKEALKNVKIRKPPHMVHFTGSK